MKILSCIFFIFLFSCSCQNSKNLSAREKQWLSKTLDSISNVDQNDRVMLEYIAHKHGWRSHQIDSLWKKINKQDSLNLIAVKKIIDQYGWLTAEEVGGNASDVIFYVLQHSDTATQITYLAFVRDAVKKGKTKKKFLALYEDRALMWQGKKQIYGTQWETDSTGRTTIYPIEDEINVNKRRLPLGLDSIAGRTHKF